MKTLLNFKTLVISLSVSLFVSCMNTNVPELSSSYTTIANEALATATSESAVLDADLTINTYIKTAGMQKVGAAVTPPIDKDSVVDAKNEAYPKVTRISEKDAFPREYVIDFGDGYITKSKLKYKGKIHYTVNDITCQKREYKFENFSINDNPVECTKTVEVVSKGVLRIVSEETTKPAKGGNAIYRYSERKRTKLDSSKGVVVGDGDSDLDDYTVYNYSFDIITKGINAKGEEYSLKTVEPLISDYAKKGFVKGIMSVTTKKGTKHLDYSKQGENKEVDYKENNNNSENNNSNNNSDNQDKSNNK
ncbi:MAG: hypothetical protein WCK78_12325 [Paludibacter sp.]